MLTKDAATVIALLLLAGAVGKSAQLPLHVWLPDAMEGPTPVSALIHAATMVTAGVYLVVRSHVLFELSGVALTVVLVIGLATAIYAATSAIGQDDIKRVLAYSTISQLGYMFVAAGMRAYAVAIFLLVAHAFYKALMFLGAGSVIHGMHDEQDMRQMGGPAGGHADHVRRRSRSAALCAQPGIPPLAGFFAKDQVLAGRRTTPAARPSTSLGTIAAFLTAFYIGRHVFLTFFGRPRSDAAEHAHESPRVMRAAARDARASASRSVVLLETSPEGRLARALEPVVGPLQEGGGLSVVALAGIAVAVSRASRSRRWWIYGSGRVDWWRSAFGSSRGRPRAQHGWYVDGAYDIVFVQPAKALAALVGVRRRREGDRRRR